MQGLFLAFHLVCAFSFESLLWRCFWVLVSFWVSLCKISAGDVLLSGWVVTSFFCFLFLLFFFSFFLAGSHRLKQLLSFAIGGLLGNVFLHLLPEAWAYTCSATTGRRALGAWKQLVLAHFETVLPWKPKNSQSGSAEKLVQAGILFQLIYKSKCLGKDMRIKKPAHVILHLCIQQSSKDFEIIGFLSWP